MERTARAQELWERYQADVRRALAASDVDAEDVLAGIREHVEAEAVREGLSTVTGEDLAEILDRLGPPQQWAEADPGDASSSGRNGGDGAAADLSPEGRAASLAALVLVIVGVTLVLLGLWSGVGWGFLVIGAVLARAAVGDAPPPTDGAGSWRTASPLRRLASVIWWVAVVGAAAALLFAPAVLTWAAAQTGGWLEAPLTERFGAGPRPAAYWRATVLLIGALSGTWWLVSGGLLLRFREGLRGLLGEAAIVLPRRAPRVLLVAGTALLVLSVGGMVLL